MYRILIVDDEITMLKGIQFNLQDNPNYELFTASDKESAMEILKNNELDLVVSDLMLPKIKDGLEIMKEAKAQWYQPAVLAMTAFETVENAIETMRAGADDFVSKGFGIDELSLRIENMLRKKVQINRLTIENQILKEAIQHQYSNYKIVGASKIMLELMKKIHKVATDAKATCLILGESGTGKDLIARTIHILSERKNSPFIPVNCAAIPDNLIESELFGHEKGAFTGAYTARQGKFEHANGGIIFLDEIGELPYPLQVSLLRVLEERSFYRIGGKRAIDVDVMILSASNQNLSQQVVSGKFREDLFYRLNVINIEVPPLRERQEDIEPLAQFFLDKFNKERKKELKFSKTAIQTLESHTFPGNVRELRNVIEDAFVFCEGPLIKPEDLFVNNIKITPSRPEKTEENLNQQYYTLSHKNAIASFEKVYFHNLLQENFWNLNVAATKAEISREWLSKKIKQLGIKRNVN